MIGLKTLLTQISGRSGDCIEQVSAAFLAFQKAFKADELAGELDDLEKAIRRLKRDRSTWQEIRRRRRTRPGVWNKPDKNKAGKPCPDVG